MKTSLQASRARWALLPTALLLANASRAPVQAVDTACTKTRGMTVNQCGDGNAGWSIKPEFYSSDIMYYEIFGPGSNSAFATLFCIDDDGERTRKYGGILAPGKSVSCCPTDPTHPQSQSRHCGFDEVHCGSSPTCGDVW